ncbi:MAG: TPM domain-containing protein [Nitrospiraceae bacterium]
MSATLVFLWQVGFRQSSVDYADDGGKLNWHRHLYDTAGIIPLPDAEAFEGNLFWIFHESDIDVYIILAKDTGLQSIEEYALEKMHQLRIGGMNREERGVLLLFDLKQRQLRIEVGYGLEEYLPDAFISYLVHDHGQAYFSSGDFSLGLRLLLDLLHGRIRDAVFGNRFNPTVLEVIQQRHHLSGGAGVSARMTAGGQERAVPKGMLDEADRRRFSPQPTPEAAYQCYLEWLERSVFDPKVELFTANSRDYMDGLAMSKAWFDAIILSEYGRTYKIVSRDDVALQYFIGSPLENPHFFMKNKNGWQMDIAAEVANISKRVGGVYTWDYKGKDDIYTKTFADKLKRIKGYIRIDDGDNRMLPIRGSSGLITKSS